ncbi:helix-turn-helix transcriptional regulator [Azospirillum sp. RWY-5-1]|uniref:Helix-turn-helix transcriptional regulator n=1 Tax=Azospirillum oleiclasticum TaxID=2735135 RepID=A0ABX2TDC5_9PROT|nr:helix-turn-helix transcriptional regulator [Azospirillum oleiclasticum]NYZ14813.1 helix-turn-helix transcriptional regulator [Azospirillum oleiclasticum]NYZ22201.1 helix-turn-helix transcriptional regulator [Azospirillum oleiclasticum]
MEGLGDRLRVRALALGLSDAEVARRSGLDSRRYGHYVRGLHEPDLGTLVRIAEVLGTTPDGLLLSAPRPMSVGRELPERVARMARLLAMADVLDDDDLDLAAEQVEALVRHRRTRADQEDRP